LFSPDDAIVAIATPQGRGGIGIVRLSGGPTRTIAAALLNGLALEPRHATLAHVAGDEVIATFFPSPHSYTGQDVLEISAHGSPVVLNAIITAAIAAGARLAEPGEFTLRAFLGGKRDLVQAEAVADLVDAATPLQARVAFDQLEGTLTQRINEIDAALFDVIARLEASLDFPDEGYHFVNPGEAAQRLDALTRRLDELLQDGHAGRVIREGATVVIAGRPNVGKSSIFNVLVGSDRAIVTPVAGTTRDLVTEKVDVGGLALTLVDTAGWRETLDVVEREGVQRSAKARQVADVILVVLDRSEPLTPEDEQLLAQTASRNRLIVKNKSDREPSRIAIAGIDVSASTGAGIDTLRRDLAQALTAREPLRDTAALSNIRHIALLEQARVHLLAATAAAGSAPAPEEFVLADLQAAREKLDEIVGRRTSEDVLRHIFERFCIGK
jgi:tRNA modification GTPase